MGYSLTRVPHSLATADGAPNKHGNVSPVSFILEGFEADESRPAEAFYIFDSKIVLESAQGLGVNATFQSVSDEVLALLCQRKAFVFSTDNRVVESMRQWKPSSRIPANFSEVFGSAEECQQFCGAMHKFWSEDGHSAGTLERSELALFAHGGKTFQFESHKNQVRCFSPCRILVM